MEMLIIFFLGVVFWIFYYTIVGIIKATCYIAAFIIGLFLCLFK